MLTSLGPFLSMDDLVTIPADGLQVLNAMSSAMGPVLAMMNLQVTARAAPCAAPAMLLHGLAAVNKVDGMHERSECYEVSLADGFHDQSVTLKSADGA